MMEALVILSVIAHLHVVDRKECFIIDYLGLRLYVQKFR